MCISSVCICDSVRSKTSSGQGEKSARDGSSQRVPRQVSATRGQKSAKSSGSSSSSSQLTSNWSSSCINQHSPNLLKLNSCSVKEGSCRVCRNFFTANKNSHFRDLLWEIFSVLAKTSLHKICISPRETIAGVRHIFHGLVYTFTPKSFEKNTDNHLLSLNHPLLKPCRFRLLWTTSFLNCSCERHSKLSWKTLMSK